MDRFDIQVNKTTSNTVLIIIHIGATRGMVTYLLEALSTMAKEIESSLGQPTRGKVSIKNRNKKGNELRLNDNSEFHPIFKSNKNKKCSEESYVRYAAEMAKRRIIDI